MMLVFSRGLCFELDEVPEGPGIEFNTLTAITDTSGLAHPSILFPSDAIMGLAAVTSLRCKP